MGDSLKPQRIFFFHSIKTTKAANMPKGGGLTKPMKLSSDLADIVGKKEASRAECISSSGLTSRRTTSRTPRTSNTFSPTKRWQRFSVATVSALSAWPSSSPLTCPKLGVHFGRQLSGSPQDPLIAIQRDHLKLPTDLNNVLPSKCALRLT